MNQTQLTQGHLRSYKLHINLRWENADCTEEKEWEGGEGGGGMCNKIISVLIIEGNGTRVDLLMKCPVTLSASLS